MFVRRARGEVARRGEPGGIPKDSLEIHQNCVNCARVVRLDQERYAQISMRPPFKSRRSRSRKLRGEKTRSAQGSHALPLNRARLRQRAIRAVTWPVLGSSYFEAALLAVFRAGRLDLA